jgi:DNA-binding transcriptional LysR family regulator
MKLTHRQIDVFRTVMATNHVTLAADALNTSQPTVSRELARLEQVLGMRLFDRVRGRLQPTVRAVALLEEVERSYIGLDRIAAAAVGLREFAEGRLTVACLPALSGALLPDAVRRFVLKHPKAGVSITTHESPLLELQLSEQRFDLGLVESRLAPPATRLKPLLQADEVAVLPEGHTLLARKRLRLKDFAGQPFVSFAPTDPYRRAVDAMFAEQDIERVMAVDATSAVAVCALVRQGLGVGIVNPLTALELAGSGLHIRPLAASVPFEVGLVLPSLRPPSPLAESFESALFEAAAALKNLMTRP